jgi:hypothetical protein
MKSFDFFGKKHGVRMSSGQRAAMKTAFGYLNNQNGFSLLWSILIALIVMVVVYAVANSTSNSSTTQNIPTYNAQGYSSSIMGQAAQLVDGVNSVMLSNTIAISAVTADTVAGTGLYNGTNGISKPNPIAAALNTVANQWVFKNPAAGNVKLNGIGTGAGNYVFALADVKDAVCQQINLARHGAVTVPTDNALVAAWNTPATAVDDSAVVAMLNWDEGCIKTTDGKDVYFKSAVTQ